VPTEPFFFDCALGGIHVSVPQQCFNFFCPSPGLPDKAQGCTSTNLFNSGSVSASLIFPSLWHDMQ
jgi:hypothetical protein